MPDLTVHPTKKWISLSYTVTFMVIIAAVIAYVNYFADLPAWPLIIPALLLLWPISRDIRRRFTKITIVGDKLRYECGVLSRTTRTIQLSKIQDVRVDQTLRQRLFGLGNLSIETAGETSRLVIANIDQPQQVADEIMDAGQGPAPKPKGERK